MTQRQRIVSVASPVFNIDRLLPPGVKSHRRDLRRPPQFRARLPRRGAELPRPRRPDPIATKAGGHDTSGRFRWSPPASCVSLIGKPEPHALLHQMRVVQMLRQPEHAAQKKAADLDRRLAHAAREMRRALDHQHPESGHSRRRSVAVAAPASEPPIITAS